MNPYPQIYCPPGIAKPKCCPHSGGCDVRPGKGPDELVDQVGDGRCWGGDMRPGDWRKTAPGWWVRFDGQRPQDLLRLSPHRAIQHWATVPGIGEDHQWRVPVILVTDGGLPLTALDRILTGDGWQEPGDLHHVQAPLLAIANRTPLAIDQEARNAAVVALAIDLLALGHWIDRDLLLAFGWLSERLMIETVRAAQSLSSVEDVPC